MHQLARRISGRLFVLKKIIRGSKNGQVNPNKLTCTCWRGKLKLSNLDSTVWSWEGAKERRVVSGRCCRRLGSPRRAIGRLSCATAPSSTRGGCPLNSTNEQADCSEINNRKNRKMNEDLRLSSRRNRIHWIVQLRKKLGWSDDITWHK